MSITLEQYIEFYNENKNIILMKEGSNYPINNKGLQQWVESVENKKNNILCGKLTKVDKGDDIDTEHNCDDKDNSDTYNLFAHMFLKILRHISFKEMCDRIKLIVAEIITLYTTNKYDIIYIFIDGIAQKSNTWLSLLYVKYLLELRATQNISITDIITKSKVIDNFDSVDKEVGNNKKILILHIDDMIYSGNQVVQSITNNRDNIEQINNKNSIDYYLCVAYISNNAKTRFITTYYNFIKFFGNTEVIDNFISHAHKIINNTSVSLNEKEKKTLTDNLSKLCGNTEDNTYKLGNRAFRCFSKSPLIAVYFDHKLPDIVSFFNRIVNYGMFPSNTDNNGNYMKFEKNKIQYKSPAQHIITNCNIVENKDEDGNQRDCPPAFYKQLPYKFKLNNIYMGGVLETKYYIVAQILRIIQSPQIASLQITSQAKTATRNNNTYDSIQFNNDLKNLIPVKNIQKQTYDKFKENVKLDSNFKNYCDVALSKYFKNNTKNYNIFYILYAFIILYCIIVYKFKLYSYDIKNLILLYDVIMKLLNNIVGLDIEKLIDYLNTTFIKNNANFKNKTLSHYLLIEIDKKTLNINTITIQNIT